jgi:hypothetical protein
MFQKADPDHMLSHGTTYVRIIKGSRVGELAARFDIVLGYLPTA